LTNKGRELQNILPWILLDILRRLYTESLQCTQWLHSRPIETSIMNIITLAAIPRIYRWAT